MVSMGVSRVAFLGFLLAETLVAGTGGVAGEDAGATGVDVIGVGSVVGSGVESDVCAGSEFLTGEADAGLFSLLFGDFLFFLDTSVQPSFVLG